MDILIRNIDEIALNEIEQAAYKANMSRQVYLKRLIEQVAYQEMFTKEQQIIEKTFHLTQQQLAQGMQQQGELYKKLIRIESILCTLLDIDMEQSDALFASWGEMV